MNLLPLIRAARWAIADPYLRAIAAIARDGHGPAGGSAEATARREARMQRRQAAGVASPEALPGTFSVTMHGDCALIPIDGPIFRRANMFMDFSGGTSTEYLTHDIRAALDSERVRSILLLIDSPGGEAKGIHELAQLLYAGRAAKPIHAYTDGDCCSGAYWLAAAAHQITLDDSALIGSVGVVLTVDDPAHEINDDGTIEIVSSMSDLKRPDPHSEDGRAALQTLVDDLGWLFVDRVAEYRGLTRAAITAVRGGVLVGQRAVDASFADALGSFASALADCQQAGRDAASGMLTAASTPIIAMEEPPMPTEQDTQLLAAALGTDDSAEARTNARINELEALIAQQQITLESFGSTITTQQEAISAQGQAITTLRSLEARLAVLEGDAPTQAGMYRASTQARPLNKEDEADATLLAAQPMLDDPLDSFLSPRR